MYVGCAHTVCMYVWDGWRCSAVKVLCIVMHSISRCRSRAPRAGRRTPRHAEGFRFWWCWITIFWLLLALFKRRLDEKKMENRAYTLHGGYISKQWWSYTNAILGKHTSQLVSRPFSFLPALCMVFWRHAVWQHFRNCVLLMRWRWLFLLLIV